MLIEIRLLARLLRLPLLRVEGVIRLREDAQRITTNSAAARPRMINTMRGDLRGSVDGAPLGRDLAEAEAIISSIDRSGSH